MKLSIIATKLNAEKEPYTAFHQEYEGHAFAVIKSGFVSVINMDTRQTLENIIKIDDYEDVSIYNY